MKDKNINRAVTSCLITTKMVVLTLFGFSISGHYKTSPNYLLGILLILYPIVYLFFYRKRSSIKSVLIDLVIGALILSYVYTKYGS